MGIQKSSKTCGSKLLKRESGESDWRTWSASKVNHSGEKSDCKRDRPLKELTGCGRLTQYGNIALLSAVVG